MEHYSVNSATVIPGKQKEALESLNTLLEHFKETINSQTEILRSMDGPTGRYHWVSKWESQAASEVAFAKWAEDPKYQEFAATQHEYWKDFEFHRHAIVL